MGDVMRVLKTGALVVALLLSVPAAGPVAAAVESHRQTDQTLVAKPASVDFHSRKVGTENYKRTKITNASKFDVRLVVTAALPDDFGFGLLPGQSCPVFEPGEVLAAGASCYAVVRFSPSEFFAGWTATGTLTATATDPVTGAPVDQINIPVLGKGVL
jgi:hypothetical protein